MRGCLGSGSRAKFYGVPVRLPDCGPDRESDDACGGSGQTHGRHAASEGMAGANGATPGVVDQCEDAEGDDDVGNIRLCGGPGWHGDPVDASPGAGRREIGMTRRAGRGGWRAGRPGQRWPPDVGPYSSACDAAPSAATSRTVSIESQAAPKVWLLHSVSPSAEGRIAGPPVLTMNVPAGCMALLVWSPSRMARHSSETRCPRVGEKSGGRPGLDAGHSWRAAGCAVRAAWRLSGDG